jgi:hypothetical protein
MRNFLERSMENYVSKVDFETLSFAQKQNDMYMPCQNTKMSG